MTYQAKLRVWRGDDEGGGLQDYEVGVNEGEVVLDIIHRLQAEQTPDLAVRWNCKAGKCGSCSAEINGRPRLMCMTRMSTFDESETVTITPLRTFPVIVGLSLLSYAVNLFIFASGRLAIGLPPIWSKTAEGYSDPLVQALVLTAIVISFGMTAVIVMLGLGAYLEAGDDRIDMEPSSPADDSGEDRA